MTRIARGYIKDQKLFFLFSLWVLNHVNNGFSLRLPVPFLGVPHQLLPFGLNFTQQSIKLNQIRPPIVHNWASQLYHKALQHYTWWDSCLQLGKIKLMVKNSHFNHHIIELRRI